jgi:hypothetical protein
VTSFGFNKIWWTYGTTQWHETTHTIWENITILSTYHPYKLPLLHCRCPNDSLILPIFTEAHLAPHVYGLCEAVNLPDPTATGPQWLFNKMAHREECVYSRAVFPVKWIGREEPTPCAPPSPCLTPCGSWMLWCLYVRGPRQVYQVYEASLVGFEQN